MASESGVSIGDEDCSIPSESDPIENSAHVTQCIDDHMAENGDQVTHIDGSSVTQTDRCVTTKCQVMSSNGCVIDPSEGRVTELDGHEIQRDGYLTKSESQMTDADIQVVVVEESDEDTAGEFGDVLPQDSTSTATDAPLEPVDFIETHPHGHSHCFGRVGGIGAGRNILRAAPGIHYENWSVLEELRENAKKGMYLILV